MDLTIGPTPTAAMLGSFGSTEYLPKGATIKVTRLETNYPALEPSAPYRHNVSASMIILGAGWEGTMRTGEPDLHGEVYLHGGTHRVRLSSFLYEETRPLLTHLRISLHPLSPSLKRLTFSEPASFKTKTSQPSLFFGPRRRI